MSFDILQKGGLALLFLFLILGIECCGTAFGNGQKYAAEIIAGV